MIEFSRFYDKELASCCVPFAVSRKPRRDGKSLFFLRVARAKRANFKFCGVAITVAVALSLEDKTSSRQFWFGTKRLRLRQRHKTIIHFRSLRRRLHERGFTSTRFYGFETASKSMRFGGVYTEPFLLENSSRDGISERCTLCYIHYFELNNANFASK